MAGKAMPSSPRAPASTLADVSLVVQAVRELCRKSLTVRTAVSMWVSES